MILSGRQITEQIHEGGIVIDPFDPSLVGPNSCNLRLHNSLQRYTGGTLDMAKRNQTEDLEIPKEGFTLVPGELYLGRTLERTGTDRFVPMIEGRSSVGRLGIFVHVTAGFGDIGFSGTWTLEIMAVKPVVIYPFVPICQLYFHTIEGEFDLYKSKKYQGQNKIISSRFWKDITRVPSVGFFDHLEEKFYDLLVEIGKSSSVGPVEFEVFMTDDPQFDSSYKPEGLMEYVFTHKLDADFSFPRHALIEFYSEIPCCLNIAMVTMKSSLSGKAQTRIEVQ
jgi:dCTP deaminase